jgi:N-methylhydantoinase B/oxoprolinase/acetone carboxylase alpha subunit
MSNEQQQNQKVNTVKVNEKFNEVQARLSNVFGVNALNDTHKISQNQAKSIVDEILSERAEETALKVKTDLKALVKKNVEHQRTVKKLREEFDKNVAIKQQEFINAANEILSLIDKFEEDKVDYQKSIDTLSEGELNGNI